MQINPSTAADRDNVILSRYSLAGFWLTARVNLITGFLGSGKTALPGHLLAARSPGEKWALLVNELGETGLDGALLAAPRIVANENVHDQLAAADIIVANKRDCRAREDRLRLAV